MNTTALSVIALDRIQLQAEDNRGITLESIALPTSNGEKILYGQTIEERVHRDEKVFLANQKHAQACISGRRIPESWQPFKHLILGEILAELSFDDDQAPGYPGIFPYMEFRHGEWIIISELWRGSPFSTAEFRVIQVVPAN